MKMQNPGEDVPRECESVFARLAGEAVACTTVLRAKSVSLYQGFPSTFIR